MLIEYEGIKLFAPAEFWDKFDYFISNCNGCGNDSSKSVTNFFGINTNSILGCNVRIACAIHDYCYHEPEHTGRHGSIEHKMQADRIFLNNLLRIIEEYGRERKPWRITQWTRRKIAYGYFAAVKKFGGPSYWDEQPCDLGALHA